jgi:hypothetical protein
MQQLEFFRPFTPTKVPSYSRAPSELEKIFYQRFVRRLVERRHQLHLTQEELDHIIGVSEGQVARWETFVRLPGAFMMTCWSNALGLIISLEPEQKEAA